jgi:hypothetical protein
MKLLPREKFVLILERGFGQHIAHLIELILFVQANTNQRPPSPLPFSSNFCRSYPMAKSHLELCLELFRGEINFSAKYVH